ncbi:MAG: DUF3426 domain-containing protein [Desulfuromonadales bacterium]|nr:MAG: DUF3426 domain-containing protein [Desulfuromonadales bacterium]
MIIQCAQCSAKFRLDDAKVTEAGIKVRCSKCKHIFVVRKEAPVEEADLDAVLQGLETPRHEAVRQKTEMMAAAAPTLAGVGEAVSSGFSFDAGAVSEGNEPSLAAEEPSENFSMPGPFDAALDRAEATAGSDEAPSIPPMFEPVRVEDAEVGSGESTHEDIMFGEVSPEAFAAATGTAGGAGAAVGGPEITFEFDDEGEAEGVGAEPGVKGDAGDMDFGEIDFGIEDSEPEESGGEASSALVFPDAESEQPAVGEREGEVPPTVADVPPLAVVPPFEEEPPLTISSRRKGQSFLPAVVISVSVLVIVALAGFGFYFFKEGPSALDKLGVGFLSGWLGVEAKEDGSITLGKVHGAYLVNAEAGEVFVIRGEAVNAYRKPRASIQVRGAILGPNGQVVAQKVAYCGNSLSDDQIRTMPVSKVDAAMGNQFGDSLANLGVQPGKAIPFVVVLSGVPKDAVDYSVEVVGSTAASQ